MTAVGMFAGRGDVVLAMFVCVLLGFWLGYKWRGLVERWRARRKA